MKIGNPADKRNIAPVVTTPADAKAADKTAAGAANPASVDPSAKVSCPTRRPACALAPTLPSSTRQRSSASRKPSPTAATRSTPR